MAEYLVTPQRNGILLTEKNGKRQFVTPTGEVYPISPDDERHARFAFACALARLRPHRSIYPAAIPPAGFLLLANARTGRSSLMFSEEPHSLRLAIDELTRKGKHENT